MAYQGGGRLKRRNKGRVYVVTCGGAAEAKRLAGKRNPCVPARRFRGSFPQVCELDCDGTMTLPSVSIGCLEKQAIRMKIDGDSALEAV
jgi:hypothetical protein